MREETTVSDSIGTTIDAELAVLKARLAVIEAAASTDWAKVKASVKRNIPHAVTWAGLVAAITHQAGLWHL